MENSSHHIRDFTFAEDASTVRAGTAPRAMATLRNFAIGALKSLGADNIAKTTRAIRDEPERALPIPGITNYPGQLRNLIKPWHQQPNGRPGPACRRTSGFAQPCERGWESALGSLLGGCRGRCRPKKTEGNACAEFRESCRQAVSQRHWPSSAPHLPPPLCR